MLRGLLSVESLSITPILNFIRSSYPSPVLATLELELYKTLAFILSSWNILGSGVGVEVEVV